MDVKSMRRLFITSDELMARIHDVACKINEAAGGDVVLEEFIALPACGGNIVLRFNLQSDTYTLDNLDSYEHTMNTIAGDEFLVDFMGSVYRAAGVDYSRLGEILGRFAEEYRDEPILTGKYCDRIRNDADVILSGCGFTCDLPVWEIQYEDDGYVVLLLGDKNEKLGEGVFAGRPVEIFETRRTECEGLMKAAFTAKRTGVSLGRLMISMVQ